MRVTTNIHRFFVFQKGKGAPLSKENGKYKSIKWNAHTQTHTRNHMKLSEIVDHRLDKLSHPVIIYLLDSNRGETNQAAQIYQFLNLNISLLPIMKYYEWCTEFLASRQTIADMSSSLRKKRQCQPVPTTEMIWYSASAGLLIDCVQSWNNIAFFSVRPIARRRSSDGMHRSCSAAAAVVAVNKKSRH